MPFIPHTETDIKTMLAAIDVQSIDLLFDGIPEKLRNADFTAIPDGVNEMAIARLMQQRAKQDEAGLCFIGAGAYEHHIPSAILDLISRGEFLTAYTPYQAEASQGTLQLIYEFQTMMASLMGLDVSNASLYEGASGLAEAILMAVRANKHSKSKRILIPSTVHPLYREVAKAIVSSQDIILETIPYDTKQGVCSLPKLNGEDIAAIVIQQPNFFGKLEDVDALTDWAHEHHALVIAVVNPMAMALLKEPGSWGKTGADIACGEGQSLGVPLASGGPYFGFMCCKQEFVRQMPGRIVGRTLDSEGKTGFTLTLQAREQHIRRSKATSNICTNQGLMVTAATIYMSLLGGEGLKNVAMSSHHNATILRQQLSEIEGVHILFENPFFHEFVLQLPKQTSTAKTLEALAKKNIQGGFDLTPYYPELGNCILVCATETKTAEDLQAYTAALQQLLKQHATV